MVLLREKVRLFTRFLKSLMGRVLKAVSVRLVRGAFGRRTAGVQRHRAGEERWGVSSEATVVVVVVVVVALWWRRA